MCGRYFILAHHPKLTEIIEKAQKASPSVPFQLGEVFPGTKAPILIGHQHKIYARFAHWGLYHKIINARQETLLSKPVFARDFEKRRALVPVSGFYEWDQHKKRYCFVHQEEPILYLAAIYNENHEFAIITTDAKAPVQAIHHRMPVIISNHDIQKWLFDTSKAMEMLKESYFDLKIKEEVTSS